MSVIQEGDIESKDFSAALPAITDKLNFLVNVFNNVGFNDKILDPTCVHGLYLILQDIQDDLENINEAVGSNICEVVCKHRFLLLGIQSTDLTANTLEPEAIHGLAHILGGIEGDINTINDALYPAERQGA